MPFFAGSVFLISSSSSSIHVIAISERSPKTHVHRSYRPANTIWEKSHCHAFIVSIYSDSSSKTVFYRPKKKTPNSIKTYLNVIFFIRWFDLFYWFEWYWWLILTNFLLLILVEHFFFHCFLHFSVRVFLVTQYFDIHRFSFSCFFFSFLRGLMLQLIEEHMTVYKENEIVNECRKKGHQHQKLHIAEC